MIHVCYCVSVLQNRKIYQPNFKKKTYDVLVAERRKRNWHNCKLERSLNFTYMDFRFKFFPPPPFDSSPH
jgi:hypothetical protein